MIKKARIEWVCQYSIQTRHAISPNIRGCFTLIEVGDVESYSARLEANRRSVELGEIYVFFCIVVFIVFFMIPVDQDFWPLYIYSPVG